VNAAQAATAGLCAILIAAAAVLIVTEHPVWGAINLGFGLLGFVSLLGMIVTDKRT